MVLIEMSREEKDDPDHKEINIIQLCLADDILEDVVDADSVLV